jgi:hypothetical protein
MKCGREHDPDAMELGFDQPDLFFEIPRHERDERVTADDDLCQIDDRFYIRGFVEIPRTDSRNTFAFGMWAEVPRRQFERYVELYSDDRQAEESPFDGRLANELSGYSTTTGLKVLIHLVSPTSRPKFQLVDKRHQLGREQLRGIDSKRVMEILDPHIH